MSKNKCFFRIIILLSLFSIPLFGKKFEGPGGHRDEMRYVLSGLKGEKLDELLKSISEGIDTDFCDIVRKKWGQIHGNHRIIGHWGFQGSIPFNEEPWKTALSQYPKKELIEEWQQFVNKLIENTTEQTGLNGKHAKGLTGLVYNIHLLGDKEPGNVVTDLVKKSDLLCNDIEKNLKNLFGNNSESVQIFKNGIKQIPKNLSDELKAQEIQRVLGKCSIGKNLAKTYGKNLTEKGIKFSETLETGLIERSRPILNNNQVKLSNYLKQHVTRSRILENEVLKKGKLPVRNIANSFKDISNTTTNEVNNVQYVTGTLQKCKVKGFDVHILSIPVSVATRGAAAVLAGTDAGVMTFICMEGTTVYKFCKGDITDDIFIRDTMKNIGVAVAVGTAVLVTVALGATPEGWVVLGVAVGVSIVADLVFEKLMKEFWDTPQISMDDILAVLPTEMQRRANSLDWTEYSYKVQNGVIFDHLGQQDTSLEPLNRDNDIFTPLKNRKSVLDE